MTGHPTDVRPGGASALTPSSHEASPGGHTQTRDPGRGSTDGCDGSGRVSTRRSAHGPAGQRAQRRDVGPGRVPTVKVTTVHMPQMFCMKDDHAPRHPEVFDEPYIPMSYVLGDVCERCWLTVGIPTESDGPLVSDWLSHDDAIYPVGGFGCPHGSPS